MLERAPDHLLSLLVTDVCEQENVQELCSHDPMKILGEGLMWTLNMNCFLCLLRASEQHSFSCPRRNSASSWPGPG